MFRSIPKGPFIITLFYLLVSVVWIVASDGLIQQMSVTTGLDRELLQTGKGLFFVLITAILLFFFIKKQESGLIISEKQYKSLFYNNPDPLWIYDIKTLRFIEVNQAAINKYGYSRREFRQMTIQDIRPREDQQKLLESVASMHSVGYRVTDYWRHIKKNGEVILVSIRSHKIKFNNQDCVMVMPVDVTDKLKQEEQLQQAYETERQLREALQKNITLIKQSLEEKKQLADIVDRINNIVLITDKHGVITWVNQAFTNFTGYTFEEVVGKTPDILHGPDTDAEIQQRIVEAVRRNQFVDFEVLNYTKDGRAYWVQLNISPIFNEHNEVERYISIQSDITERKLREQKIKEQNKTLRKLAWTNSHAIRKPVASIMGLINLCKETNKMNEIREMQLLLLNCAEELDAVTKKISSEINREEFNS
ncbi:PAS domain S-box protein [Pedobacter sp. BS3]|uniref:PAS domain-containing protein n=1 Tax=Pedobacter sp. BS3 TaxID=2567937 RepID=UPI0011EC9733|nr:PAS domain-containing protein [Pedobacter sp. BS3]TZF84871.1 PAS domain S-box protein [Pedobacter sp. BS3]